MTIVPREVVQAPARIWQRYPEYKDSGVEWIEEIPAHWELKRLRFLCTLNPPKTEIRDLPLNTTVSFLPMEKVGEGGGLRLDETRTLEQLIQSGYTFFQNNDVVVAKITPCFENGKGALCEELVAGVGFGTTELQVLRVFGENNPKFIFYLTISDPFRRLGTSMMKGSAGQKRVPDDFTMNFSLAVPSLSDQEAIVTFLDRETMKIDDLIAKMERLIELLEEKRSALISRAVTKGLNPEVPMKDSRIQWLGEIPAHWDIKRLKHLVQFFGGGTPAKGNLSFWSGQIPWVSPKDMRFETIDDSEDHISEEALDASATQLIYAGAVLIVVRSGILKHSIPVAVNERPVALNQDMKALVPEKRVISTYLSALIRSHQKALLVHWRRVGATVESIEHELLANTQISVPPTHEQHEIARFINQRTMKIDNLVDKLREHIKKLREYRTALVFAAVTGKIDVRQEG